MPVCLSDYFGAKESTTQFMNVAIENFDWQKQ